MDNTKKKLPRLLIISFNSLLSTNANGRTIINLIENWDKSCLAQFYASPDVPDWNGCERYFRVTDEEALKALLGKQVGRKITYLQESESPKSKIYNHVKKNRKNKAFRYIRQIIWETNAWQNKSFFNWIEDFKPEAIFLLSGNNAFLDKTAMKLSKKYNIPIILYNCEDYFLKSTHGEGFFGCINKFHCDRIFKKTMKYISAVIYNSRLLEAEYKKHFKHKSIVLMNPANDFSKYDAEKKSNEISYLGNIAVGRETSLCEIADALGRHGYRLHIYGKCQSEEIAKTLNANRNIIYHGFVSFDECCTIMKRSKLLIHCESFENIHKRDLKFAFSTKIADSFACGTCLFAYLPDNITLSEYLKETNAAVLVTDPSMLEKALINVIENKSVRDEYEKRALKISGINHNKQAITKAFEELITDIVNNGGVISVKQNE